ncbi:MAG: FAD-binding protein, partial [Deltaproteobacteria bacterium]|nr:FAD-binding protein [Deltaproteobacteria bacterium]
MAEPKRIVTDVAIIGTGGAGLAAAIEARDVGAKVAMVEKAETLGGASIISGGGCSMAGTALQRENGIDDSPDLAFDDWVRFGEGLAEKLRSGAEASLARRFPRFDDGDHRAWEAAVRRARDGSDQPFKVVGWDGA